MWRWAWPFTMIRGQEEIWLIAGEDVRFALRTSHIEPVFQILGRLDSGLDEKELSASAPEVRAEVTRLLEQLRSERLLVPVQALAGPLAGGDSLRVEVIGEGGLAGEIRARLPVSGEADAVWVFCQDGLDLHAMLEFNTSALARGRRWCWVTSGPAARAYVSPLFLPDAGPCAACLLRHFRQLSPAPEVYDVLLAHGQAQGQFPTAHFPSAGLGVVAALLTWKLSLLEAPAVSSALYRLHVVEDTSLTISSHPVFRDPECPICRH